MIGLLEKSKECLALPCDPSREESPSTVRIRFEAEPETLLPWLEYHVFTHDIADYIWDSLLQQDPDTSSRWATQERIDGSRRFLQARFPLLANAPLLETRACHYESSINANFIIDHVPETQNAWIAGVGQAEGFKFAPVVGEYVAQRVLGNPGDPALVKAFKLPTEEYEKPK